MLAAPPPWATLLLRFKFTLTSLADRSVDDEDLLHRSVFWRRNVAAHNEVSGVRDEALAS